MIETSKYGAQYQKEDNCGGMYLHVQSSTVKEACKNVIVLSKEKFYRMNINGIDSGTASEFKERKKESLSIRPFELYMCVHSGGT